MRHGSLFSGIGGFDLAAEWMGWENVFHCENNPFCQQVLKYYWPEAELFTDIKTSDFKKYHGKIDIISGGFPCQPYSAAGKRKGNEDDRHLWPSMLRAIREIQPGWVVGENVFGLLNWSKGLVFHEVQTDLEAAGYECFPYVLPACAKNAPHRRDRVWIIAHSKSVSCGNGTRNEGQQTQEIQSQRFNEFEFTPNTIEPSIVAYTDGSERCEGWMHQTRSEKAERYAGSCDSWDAANTKEQRLQEWNAEQGRNGTHSAIKRHGSIPCWENFPTQPPLRCGNDGFPGKLDGLTVSKHRTESIKAYGNSVVPQIVLEIFKAIEQYENDAQRTRI